MAAIFNGSTSDLSATVSSTAHSYPTLLAAWIECDRSPDDDVVVALSDNDAAGSLDSLELRVEGSTLKGWAKAGGGGSAATQSGLPATGRVFVAAIFDSTTSRRVKIDTGNWSTTSTTSRAPGNFTRVSIGAVHSSGATAVFDGPIAHAAIWRGIDSDNVDLLVSQLSLGMSPAEAWHVATPYMYQPVGPAANSDKIGPTLTATAVDFQDTIQNEFIAGTITRTQYDSRMAAIEGFDLGTIRLAAGFYNSPDYDPAQTDDVYQLNPGCWSHRWPDDISTPGLIARKRIVKLGSDGKLTLAGASDANWVGATIEPSLPGTPTSGYETLWQRQMVAQRTGGRPLYVTETNSPSWTIGTSTAYLAANGQCDDTGSVALGVVTASAGGVATIVPQ